MLQKLLKPCCSLQALRSREQCLGEARHPKTQASMPLSNDAMSGSRSTKRRELVDVQNLGATPPVRCESAIRGWAPCCSHPRSYGSQQGSGLDNPMMQTSAKSPRISDCTIMGTYIDKAWHISSYMRRGVYLEAAALVSALRRRPRQALGALHHCRAEHLVHYEVRGGFRLSIRGGGALRGGCRRAARCAPPRRPRRCCASRGHIIKAQTTQARHCTLV